MDVGGPHAREEDEADVGEVVHGHDEQPDHIGRGLGGALHKNSDRVGR